MRLLRVAASFVLGLTAVSAQGAGSDPVPTFSPGTWIHADDYPIAAKLYEMTGVTGFRLTVDQTGKASDCQITQSSGFEVLDLATCQKIMERAEFTPALDANGKAVAGAFSSRVRWALPPSPPPMPLEHTSTRTLFRIDQAGKILSCSMIVNFVGDTPFGQLSRCPGNDPGEVNMSAETALALRGYDAEPVASVEMEMSFALTPETRDSFLVDRVGYETRGVSVFRFEINTLGMRESCAIEQQRGDEKLIFNFCFNPLWSRFVPSRDASDKPVAAAGWFILRIVRKRPL